MNNDCEKEFEVGPNSLFSQRVDIFLQLKAVVAQISALNQIRAKLNNLKGYSLTTSVSIRRFPGLGDDILWHDESVS